MIALIKKYTHWLHGQWPAGTVEKLPEVNDDFTTNVSGLFVVGDLTGIPLLKLSADSGARAVQTILEDPHFQSRKKDQATDLVIIGGGVAGHAAALEAQAAGLDYTLLEASEAFSTIVNFPKGKPIYTYPTDMTPAGSMRFEAKVKEPLIDEIREQTKDIQIRKARAEKVRRSGGLLEVVLAGEDSIKAHRVIVAIGRSGNYRKLGVRGESLDKVYNRLHDPKEFDGKNVVVVGGGDSALETAIAIAKAGGNVTLSYRKAEFSRPKPDNIEQIEALKGKIDVLMASQLKAIEPEQVTIELDDGQSKTLDNDVVFAMIGREAPLDFFRRSGVRISGETRPKAMVGLVLFFLFIVAIYDWKNKAFLAESWLWSGLNFPENMPEVLGNLSAWWQAQIADRSTLISTIAYSMKSRSFYYTLLYTSAIAFFGLRRIQRRKTPYVTRQTISLILVQAIPLFLLPEIVLPYLDYNGFFADGFLRQAADGLFPLYTSVEEYAAGNYPEWGHPRAFWRAYGFILAFPLNIYNLQTAAPLPWWIVIATIQTFGIIPWLVYKYGKGAYCGWICSCGGLAETMGDAHRHKMFHGPFWNKMNMIGQVFLAVAFLGLLLRIISWIAPNAMSWLNFGLMIDGKNAAGKVVNPLSHNWFIDILFGGVIGVAFYFKYSGRIWCRFACPLAALMHIYARFSKFRIFADKKKCISCNVCTTVCHQGIDVMNFANKGLPMEDPECVRCSACVQSCPTGVLQFGQINKETGEAFRLDSLPASQVHMREGRIEV